MARSLPFLLGVVTLASLVACGDKGDDDEEDDTGSVSDPDDTGSTGDDPVDADGDGFTEDDDCDDTDAAINPDATEVCDGVDNDCDDETDEADAEGAPTWYGDADGDGYGSPDATEVACDQPSGTADNADDCDDADAAVNPGATEVCDDADVDEDCSGDADDADSGVDTSSQTAYYPDADADGYGDAGDTGTLYCDAPSGVVMDNTDCDDAVTEVNPGATEVCDDADVDEDCSGDADDADSGVDSSTQTTYYVDSDADGYGDETDAGTLYCDAPSGVVTDNTDCDDAAIGTNPGATEVCDDADVDEDCSGDADDADSGVDPSTQTTYYADADSDGYGDETDTGTLYCDAPSGMVTDNTDCDDAAIGTNPGATEVCDAADTDEDCSGDADDADSGVDTSTQTTYYADGDTDGYGDDTDTGTLYCDPPSGVVTDNTDCNDADIYSYPSATELCDGADNDCDGSSDDAGLATWWDSSGVPTDYSSTLAGTSSSASYVTLADTGELTVCEGTWYTNIYITGDADVTGQTGDPADVILDGLAEGSTLLIQGDSLDVDISGVTAMGGLGEDVFSDGTSMGGGFLCYSSDTLTEVTLTDVVLSESYADYGGGLGIYDCNVTGTDVVLDANEGTYGAQGFVYGGDLQLTDSEITDGYSTNDVGGVVIYGQATAATATFTDTHFEGNLADDAVGALYLYESSATMTGSAGSGNGFNLNQDVSGYGAVSLSSGSSITFTTVDFGTSATDDNVDFDVSTNGGDYAYYYDDDESFSCDGDRCGTQAFTTVVTDSTDGDTSAGARGNVFLADQQGTIEDFSFYLASLNGDGCDVDFHILSAATTSDASWTVEWSQSTSVTSTTVDWVDADPVGFPVVVGTYYALVIAWECTGSDELVYSYEATSSSGEDMALGDSAGRWLEGTDVDLTAYDGTVDSGYSSSSFLYYQAMHTSH